MKVRTQDCVVLSFGLVHAKEVAYHWASYYPLTLAQFSLLFSVIRDDSSNSLSLLFRKLFLPFTPVARSLAFS